jgi:hypothetical protein
METLFSLALGTTEHTLEDLAQAFDAAARSLGHAMRLELPSDEEDEDETFDVPVPPLPPGAETFLVGFEAHDGGRVWALVEEAPRTMPELARAVARCLGTTLDVHELRVSDHEVASTEEPGEWGYESAAWSYELAADGAKRDRECPLQDGATETAHGDHYETASYLLERLVGEDRIRTLRRREYASISLLPPRLRDLANAIRSASSWEVQPQAPKSVVRVVQPDGSKRIAMLDADELRRLTDEVGAPKPR